MTPVLDFTLQFFQRRRSPLLPHLPPPLVSDSFVPSLEPLVQMGAVALFLACETAVVQVVLTKRLEIVRQA